MVSNLGGTMMHSLLVLPDLRSCPRKTPNNAIYNNLGKVRIDKTRHGMKFYIVVGCAKPITPAELALNGMSSCSPWRFGLVPGVVNLPMLET
jgi:hypothetical protein